MNSQMIRLADIGEIFGNENEQLALHAIIDGTRAVFQPWHCIGWSYAGLAGYLTIANLLNISSAAQGQPSSMALVGSIFAGGLACAALAVIGDRYRRGHMHEQGKQIAAQLTSRLQRLQAALRSERIKAWCLPHRPSAQQPFELISPGIFWGPYSEAILSGKTAYADWARVTGKKPKIGDIWVNATEVEALWSYSFLFRLTDEQFEKEANDKIMLSATDPQRRKWFGVIRIIRRELSAGRWDKNTEEAIGKSVGLGKDTVIAIRSGDHEGLMRLYNLID
jgi:hypothetical protein